MQTLSAFIPMDRRQALARGETLPNRTRGAALFADISGFTPLTAALTQELGPLRGAEELTRQLNRVFGALIAEVHRYGGSVIGFSGDAMTCWFDEATPAAANSSRRATSCALTMQQLMTQFESVNTPVGSTISFQIKIAVTAGSARRFLVGHRRIQRIEVLAGAVLDRMAAAEQQLHEGEVVVGAEVIRWFGNQAHIQEWRADPAGEHYAVVSGLAETVPPAPWPDLPDLDVDTARAWLLPPVYQRLQRGEEEFLAELRPAVPLFLKFSGLDYDQDEEAGVKLDAYIRWTQTLLARYEGYLLQLTIGDKGSYMYINFGAPLAHEDDPARAVAAALALRSVPAELNFIHDIQIGISQGQMHVGAYGGARRRTYGVQGNEVNVAARLMSHAKAGQILVTARVAKMASAEYALRDLGLVLLKGQPEPITLFSVEGKQIKQAAALLKNRSLTPMVGRDAETTFLTGQLHALLDGDNSSVVIEGEAGIGKSRLVAELIAQAETLGIPVLIGAGDAIEAATPYHAWRPIFRQLFGLNEGMDAAAAQKHVLAQLPDDPYLLERTPLLNVVLPLNLPDNELTTQMASDVRVSNTVELLVDVLTKAPRSMSALLLILEDAHWLDSASLVLADHVRRSLPSLLLVISTRPMVDSKNGAGASFAKPMGTEYGRLLAAPDMQRLRLTTLSSEAILSLVCRRLDVATLPQPVADLIWQQAEGHPFFSEEIALALRDAGLILVNNGVATLAAEAGDLRNVNFPTTIQGVITSRIDRLDPAQQLTLKVASVIGRIFSFRSLRDVYPVASEKAALASHVAALAQLDITPVERPEPDLTYIFKHVITQEVTYSLLLFAQRRQLHHAVAEWYERIYADDLSPYFPLLAHHWRRAEETTKTIEYLEQAGEQALRSGAFQEAARFFEEALALAEKKSDETNAVASSPMVARRARWLWKLGESYLRLGKLARGRAISESAIALFDRPVPATTGQLIVSLLEQLLRQLLHRLWPGRFIGRVPEETRARLINAVAIYQTLSQIYYFNKEQGLSIYAALRQLNVAERAGPSVGLVQAYGVMCIVTGIFGLPALAEIYYNRALTVAQHLAQSHALVNVFHQGSMFRAGIGQFTRARDELNQALEIYDQLGNKGSWRDCLAILAAVEYFASDFKGVRQTLARFPLSTSDEDKGLLKSWELQWQSGIALRQNRLDEALTLLQQASTLLGNFGDQLAEISHFGLLANVYCRLGKPRPAQEAADKALHLITQSKGVPTSYFSLDGYAGAAETYLVLWEVSQKQQARKQTRLKKSAQQACRALHIFKWFYPIGQPNAWLYQGWYHWLNGKPVKAHKAWQKCLEVANRLDMPYEQGRAHYEISRHLSIDHAARNEHLTHACEIFDKLGVAYDLARTDMLFESNLVLPD